MDAAGWSALGTWVTAAIYVALLAYAVRQVGEATRLRRAQTRPFVVVDLEPGYLIYLTVENIGTTVARNVTFSFEPALASTLSKRKYSEFPSAGWSAGVIGGRVGAA